MRRDAAPGADMEHVYELTVDGAPRFRLEVPRSIDNHNLTYTLVGSPPLTPPSGVTISLPRPLQDFLGEHNGPSTDALISALPQGDYFIIKSPRALNRPRFLCVGNDSVPANEGVRCLVNTASPPDTRSHEFRLKAYILGADPTSSTCMGQPMLGMTVTRLDGSHASAGLLFLPIGQPSPHAPADELLLVVPRRGELVIDVKAVFSDGFPEHYPDDWWRGHDMLAARLLATSAEA